MKFQISQKTYPGEFPRPTVNIEVHDDENLAIISTPWGSREGERFVRQILRDHYNLTLSDPEATSPFTKISSLSTQANCLRIAALLANESVFHKYNRTQYTTGCEILALSVNHAEITWIHFGQPHFLIFRDGNLQMIQGATDLAFQYNNEMPLPEKLIGIEKNIELETNSIVLQSGDKLVFLSRIVIPGSFFYEKIESRDDELICQKLFDLSVDQNPRDPFWICVLSLT